MIIQELAGQLIIEINNQVEKEKALTASLAALDRANTALHEKEVRISRRESDYLQKKSELEKEKEYVLQGLEKVKRLETIQLRIDGKIALIEEKIKEVTQKENEQTEKNKILDKKLEQVNNIDRREEDLKRGVELLKKEQEALLKQREDQDLREQAIQAEAGRLKKIAERYQIR